MKKENEGMASEMKKLLETIATNEKKFVAEKEQMRYVHYTQISGGIFNFLFAEKRLKKIKECLKSNYYQ